MRITEDVRKYAAEQGIAETEALETGLKEKSAELVEKGGEVYAKAGAVLKNAMACVPRIIAPETAWI